MTRNTNVAGSVPGGSLSGPVPGTDCGVPHHYRRDGDRFVHALDCDSLARRGFALIEAYPFKDGASQPAADHYHGPLPLFIDAGFGIVRDEPTMTLVRMSLANT